MANLYWPSEKAFKYEFNKELDLEIPLKDNEIKKGTEEIENDDMSDKML